MKFPRRNIWLNVSCGQSGFSWWFDKTCMSITLGKFLCYINMINEYDMNISTSKTQLLLKTKNP